MLHISQAAAGDLDRAHFRQGHSAFAVDHSLQALSHTAPEFNAQPIAGADHVIRARGQIHRQIVQVARPVAKNVHPEALEDRRPS